MRGIRKKIATGAVVLALGVLGGVAWGSNPAAHHTTPAAVVSTTHGGSTTRSVSTGTSGAAATPVANTQPLPSLVSTGGRRDD
jgi:hypothetical protein